MNTFPIEYDQIKHYLDHRYPILLLDKVLSVEFYKEILAVKAVSASDQVLQGHYPEFAVWPGIYIVEALSQASGFLVMYSKKEKDHTKEEGVIVLTLLDKVKFRYPVKPGNLLYLSSKVEKIRRDFWTFNCTAYLEKDNKKIIVANAMITATVRELGE